MMSKIKFYKETDFKETSMGKIPNDWDFLKLGDESVSEIIMGQSPPSSTYNKDRVGLSFLQGKMEFGDIYPSATVYCSEPIKIAESNDVLFSVRAPVGDVNIALYKLCIGRGLAAIRFNSRVANHLFYFYYLQKARNFLKALGKGSTFKAINKGDLENFKVRLPPLPEQRRIVEVLSVVDLAIGKVDEVIAKTERLKKGLMQQLLTKGIQHKEYKDTKLGRIPEDWNIKKIGNVCKVVTGGTPSTQHPEYFRGNIKWLKSGDIKRLYIYDTEEKITQLGVENSNAKIHPANSVAIALSGRGQTRARTAIIKEPMTCSQSVAIMIPNPELMPEYLHYNLSNRYLEIRNLTGHLDRSGLNLSIVSNIQIPIPSVAEQEQIASILTTVDRKLELERDEKARLERVKQGLMDLLLTGKVRVKVAD